MIESLLKMSNMRVSGYLQAAGYPKSFKGPRTEQCRKQARYIGQGNVVERMDEEDDSSRANALKM
jgi:hypothetical protein